MACVENDHADLALERRKETREHFRGYRARPPCFIVKHDAWGAKAMATKVHDNGTILVERLEKIVKSCRPSRLERQYVSIPRAADLCFDVACFFIQCKSCRWIRIRSQEENGL